jgi:hypothetical protein
MDVKNAIKNAIHDMPLYVLVFLARFFDPLTFGTKFLREARMKKNR